MVWRYYCLRNGFGRALAICRAKKENLKSDIIYDFLLVAAPSAIICARAYYVIFEWENYAGEVLSVFRIWEGGLAIYGGVLGGLVTAILFCRYHILTRFRKWQSCLVYPMTQFIP